MTQTPHDLHPGRSARNLFGAELRHWRCLRELSQARLAELTHFSADLIGKIEKSQRWPRLDLVEACDAVLDTGGALGRMWPLVEAEHQRHLADPASDPDHAEVVAWERRGALLTGSGSHVLPHTGRRPARAGWRTRPGPGRPGGAPHSLEVQVLMAAHESAEYADHPSNVGPATVDRLRADATRLARSFANAPRLQVFTQARWLRDRAFSLLDGRQRVSESRELYFLTGSVCGMLADITEDFGYRDAAMAHARTGWLCAKESGNQALMAWIRCKQSGVAYYDGRPADAADYARRGQQHTTTGTVAVWLPALEARAAARLGDADATRAALTRMTEARGRVAPDDLDQVGGILSFSVPKQHFYGAEAYLGIADTPAAVEAANACIGGYQREPLDQRAYDNETGAQLDLAQALVAEDIAAARDAAQPAFRIAPELRTASVEQRFRLLHHRLTEPRLRDSPAAVDLRDQIEDFLATAPGSLPSP